MMTDPTPAKGATPEYMANAQTVIRQLLSVPYKDPDRLNAAHFIGEQANRLDLAEQTIRDAQAWNVRLAGGHYVAELKHIFDRYDAAKEAL